MGVVLKDASLGDLFERISGWSTQAKMAMTLINNIWPGAPVEEVHHP